MIVTDEAEFQRFLDTFPGRVVTRAQIRDQIMTVDPEMHRFVQLFGKKTVHRMVEEHYVRPFSEEMQRRGFVVIL